MRFAQKKPGNEIGAPDREYGISPRGGLQAILILRYSRLFVDSILIIRGRRSKASLIRHDTFAPGGFAICLPKSPAGPGNDIGLVLDLPKARDGFALAQGKTHVMPLLKTIMVGVHGRQAAGNPGPNTRVLIKEIIDRIF